MSEHTDVAAYSLGLLETDERLEFEAHLTDCQSCASELAEFSGMASLLAGVEPVESVQVETDEAEIVSLISRRAIARRHRARQRLVLAAAASLVILAGGVAAGVAVAPGQAPVVAQQGVSRSATNKLTGASATVGLVAKPWGTMITLDLSGVSGPLECQLIGVSKTGKRSVAIGWRVPATGYGTRWHPAHLVIAGGIAILLPDLARVEVDVVHGRTLINVPV
jgi:hypothetical protein